METAIVDTVHISQLRQLRANPPRELEELKPGQWTDGVKKQQQLHSPLNADTTDANKVNSVGASPSPRTGSKRPKDNGNEKNNSSAQKRNRRALFAELSTNTYKTNQAATSIRN